MLIDETNDELLDRITSIIYILGERMPRDELRQNLDDVVEDAANDLDMDASMDTLRAQAEAGEECKEALEQYHFILRRGMQGLATAAFNLCSEIEDIFDMHL
jgi:hypothetical protein